MKRLGWMFAGAVVTFGLAWGVAWWELSEASTLDSVQVTVQKMDEREVCRKCREVCIATTPEADCWEVCRKLGDC